MRKTEQYYHIYNSEYNCYIITPILKNLDLTHTSLIKQSFEYKNILEWVKSSFVIIDMKNVEFIDSSIVGMFITLYCQTKPLKKIMVCNLNKDLKKIVSVVRINETFTHTFYNTLNDCFMNCIN